MKDKLSKSFNYNSYESFMCKAGRLYASSDAKSMMMNLLKNGDSLAKLASVNIKRIVVPTAQLVKRGVKATGPNGMGV